MAARKKDNTQEEKKPDVRFKLELSLKSGVDTVDSYIKETSSHFLEMNVDDVLSWVKQSSGQCDYITGNLFRITSLADESIPTMPEEKTEEIFQSILKVVENAKQASKLMSEGLGILEEVHGKVSEVMGNMPKGEKGVNSLANVFEQVQERVYKSRKNA
jgi:hypothetical protein